MSPVQERPRSKSRAQAVRDQAEQIGALRCKCSNSACPIQLQYDSGEGSLQDQSRPRRYQRSTRTAPFQGRARIVPRPCQQAVLSKVKHQCRRRVVPSQFFCSASAMPMHLASILPGEACDCRYCDRKWSTIADGGQYQSSTSSTIPVHGRVQVHISPTSGSHIPLQGAPV